MFSDGDTVPSPPVAYPPASSRAVMLTSLERICAHLVDVDAGYTIVVAAQAFSKGAVMTTTIRAILADKGNDVHTIGRDADAALAASRMRTYGIAALVVTEGDQVLGLVGERSIMLAVADGDGSIAGLKVYDLMDTRLETCSPDDAVQQVMETMTRRRRRHIPVVEDGRLCGIVSIGDMVKFRLSQMELETRVLRDLTRH